MMKKYRSLGITTDLIFVGFNGTFLQRDHYDVVRTETNPTFWYGNMIIFNSPPRIDDYKKWVAIFKNEIADKQDSSHMVFLWDTIDGEKGEIDQFLVNGFKINQNVVLTTTEVTLPAKYNQNIEVRPLVSDVDWEQATQNQIRCRDTTNGETLEEHTHFKRIQMANYRNMQKNGLGSWYGAFLAGVLVADLGLYFQEQLGRFQHVETHPDYRRRGICATLVYEVCKLAIQNRNGVQLVMVADESYHAAAIYESFGFKPTEHVVDIWCNNVKF